jgi:thiol-disulfide isomerase/thioredoxin
MKKLLLLILIVIVAKSYAGELKFTPEKAAVGDTLEFSYNADERFIDRELRLYIYVFTNSSSMPTAHEEKLRFSELDKQFKAEFVIPEYSAFLMMSVDGNDTFFDIKDDNGGKFRDLLIYEDGKAVEGAKLKEALSYLGGYPGHFRRIIDYRKALKALNDEVNNYPDNIQAKIGLVSLLYERKKLGEDGFRGEIRDIVKDADKIKSESGLKALSRALRAINETKLAEQIERDFAGKFPESEFAEEAALAKIAEAGSLQSYVESTLDFFEKYPGSENNSKLYSALITAYLQVDKYKDLMNLLDTLGNVPPEVYAQISLELAESKDLMPGKSEQDRMAEALLVFEKAMPSGQTSIQPDLAGKPKFYPDSYWLKIRRMQLGAVAEAGGDLYAIIDKERSAKLYRRALELQQENASPLIYEKAIAKTYENGDTSGAYSLANQAILYSKSSDSVEYYHKELTQALRPVDHANYSDFMEKKYDEARENRFMKLKYTQLETEPVSGVLETPDGRFFELEDFRGNVVVFNFFSSWCGPCQETLAPFAELYDEYSGRSPVEFIALNAFEKDGNRAKTISDFMEVFDVNFSVMFDESETVPAKLGVNGLPTTVFIDREGRVRFIDQGFTTPEDYIDNALDKIDFLLED